MSGRDRLERYDPLIAPDPQAWLALGEAERIVLVEEYHRRRARIRLPNRKVHAAFHCIVETQVAMGDETSARRTVARLMREGLDRHEAVHAVGMVISDHVHDLLKAGTVEGDPNPPYFAALERLTAAEWRAAGDC